ncbi:MAG TPA: hypothetical protein VF255_11715 [Solirubrobacterales bacterium]
MAASVGGPAVADGVKQLIGPGEIKKDAIRSKHVKDGSLKARDFKPGVLLAGPRGQQGPTGPAGAPGPAGGPGPQGEWPGEATPFAIPMSTPSYEAIAGLGDFKILAGCLPEGEFSSGVTWEGTAGGPASVELMQTRRHRELSSETQLDIDAYEVRNNGAGGSTGVLSGNYRWDLEAHSSTGAISATIWLYGDDVSKCRMTARGWIEGDATFIG